MTGPIVEFTREQSLANRQYGSKILVGARAQRLAEKTVEVRPLELVKSAENGAVVEIYELIAFCGCLTSEEQLRRDAYWEGMVYLRSGRNTDALQRFEMATDHESEEPDPVLEYFATKARNEIKGASEESSVL